MGMLPWLDQPVMLHSNRNPGTCTMTAEQCAYKTAYWRFWYQADHRFSLPTVAFFMVAIGIFTIAHILTLIFPKSFQKNPLWSRLVALARFLSYKSWRIAGWNTNSLGVILLGGAGLVYFLSMTLGPKPYYWPNTKEISYGSSPPIATRTGFLALACMPFLIVLGAKANPITALTGVSHEKLNVWHNWVAWAMFVLALIHTFPFIVVHIRKGDIRAQWNDGGVWVTGVVAIIAQAWLTFMSIPWIRNRYYEFFKSTHLFMALVFVIFFFFHCDFRMSSWDYFIATAVLYTLCWLYAQCKTYFEHGIRNKARLTAESNDTLRITIDTTMEWGPGQHIFLRFLTCGAHALTAHPFTICSVPQLGRKNTLVFYVKARGGVTGRLMAMARKTPNVQVPVLMDGPYGGIPAGKLDDFDKNLIIGGGAGAGLTLSMVEDFVRFPNTGEKRQLKVIVATRDPGMRAWYMRALENIAERQSCESVVSGLSIHIHETFTINARSETETKELEVKNQSVESQECNPLTAEIFGIQVYTGRPDLPASMRQMASQEGISVGVVVCGPSSMTHDVNHAASEVQSQILGRKAGIARELWLHTESFSY
ncbi:uncharacterized protein N7477_001327 [Penicillium maclennaniae]|uniref:uncharacterized protein n=1 Tax=Penicillium maclennaniae TaxID=1343394 RepID=UPI002540B8AD|nr:uncharacterized protein N7477_001327 [Penicillium maclennaniae]KAJ5681387.1 hypothetical protein N7477_001327 [Penicillium maclennaniae]